MSVFPYEFQNPCLLKYFIDLDKAVKVDNRDYKNRGLLENLKSLSIVVNVVIEKL